MHRSASTWQFNTIKTALQMQKVWPLNEQLYYFTTSNVTRLMLSNKNKAPVRLFKVHDFLKSQPSATQVFVTMRNLVEVQSNSRQLTD